MAFWQRERRGSPAPSLATLAAALASLLPFVAKAGLPPGDRWKEIQLPAEPPTRTVQTRESPGCSPCQDSNRWARLTNRHQRDRDRGHEVGGGKQGGLQAQGVIVWRFWMCRFQHRDVAVVTRVTGCAIEETLVVCHCDCGKAGTKVALLRWPFLWRLLAHSSDSTANTIRPITC